ncbi:glycosyltransferase-like protein LARGE1, variant [Capsaspora owczarzaki ATCC 30864]|nr:glycosyltransferase-like protein LARGE1, variant [Capsaspora owczarzaki ATCC 30864]
MAERNKVPPFLTRSAESASDEQALRQLQLAQAEAVRRQAAFDQTADRQDSQLQELRQRHAQELAALQTRNDAASMLLNSIQTATTYFASAKQRRDSTGSQQSPPPAGDAAAQWDGATLVREIRNAAMSPRAATCETIHIVVVCAGFRSVRMMVPLLKSILFYRTNPLHLHFVVDEASREPIGTLIETWNLSRVELSLYDLAPFESKVASIPTVHYSGKFGLIKLVLANILPESVTHVLSLDTDLLFMRDVAHLWGHFSEFTEDQMFGLVENQSEWYIEQEARSSKTTSASKLLPSLPWPALSHGFNTGVMLLRLDRLRLRAWDETWLSVAMKELALRPAGKQTTQLADQDVINAVALTQSSIVYRLPCTWNLQLSDNSLAAPCVIAALNGHDSVKNWQVSTFAPEGNPSDPKTVISKLKNAPEAVGIVHFNSPRKMKVQNAFTEYYRHLHATFSQLDGSTLRRELISCRPELLDPATSSHAMHSEAEVESDDPCIEYRLAASTKPRTHVYYFDYIPPTAKETGQEVTWISQMSWDRLGMLEQIAERWSGPLSISLYLNDYDVDDLVDHFETSDILRTRKNIALHLVFKEGTLFPVNYLRNVALDHATTPYVFLADIDFLPSAQMATYLASMAASLDLDNKNLPKALVVPAFETFHYKFAFPANKNKLNSMLDAESIVSFRANEWPRGHSPTDFNKFRLATAPYVIQWQEDFEPYILVRRDVPRYDPRFLGFGWNKVSHIYELMKRGYQFIVVPDAFLIHLPHSPSPDIRKYRRDATYRTCLARLKEEFQQQFS